MIWGAVLTLLSFADLWLDCDHRWRAPLTEVVFAFYIIHQTIVVLMGHWLRPLDLPTLIAFLIILVATVTGCLAFWYIEHLLAVIVGGIGEQTTLADEAEARRRHFRLDRRRINAVKRVRVALPASAT